MPWKNLSRGKRAIGLAVVAAVLTASFAGFTHIRRHTGLGILALGGANYWVARARDARSSAEAKRCLLTVIQSSNYGVNAAQNAVNALGHQADRLRLFEYLAEIVPYSNWKRIYQEEARLLHSSRGADG